MRLYYLSGSTIPSREANSVHVMKMCAAFARLGHSVRLFARPRADRAAADSPFEAYGVPSDFALEFCARPAVRFAGAALYAANVARRLSGLPAPDLFYARNLHALAAVAGGRVPFAYEAHVLPQSRPARLLERYVLTRPGCRALVVISDRLRTDYIEAFPWLRPERVLVAHDGADPVQPMDPGEERAPPWPGRPGILQVGYVGHLYKGKGMEMVARLAARMPGLDFHVIGGREADLARWRDRASHPNLHYHGFVPHGRLGAYYRRLEVALAPLQSRVFLAGDVNDIGRWTSPLKLFEYMAHAKAVIASDLPVLREILEDGRTGLFCDPADEEQWVRALDRLNADRDLCSALGERANEAFLERYTWDVRASRILDAVADKARRIGLGSEPLLLRGPIHEP